MTKCTWKLNKQEHMTGLICVDASCQKDRPFYFQDKQHPNYKECLHCGREVEWEVGK